MQIKTTGMIFKQYINLILNTQHISIVMCYLHKMLHEFSVLQPTTLIKNVHIWVCAADVPEPRTTPEVHLWTQVFTDLMKCT